MPSHWPLPCPVCGSAVRQQIEFSKDASNFKQTCHDCGTEGEWEPYPPDEANVSVGYTYPQLVKAAAWRRDLLDKVRGNLVLVRRLALHDLPLRDEIGRLIDAIDDILSRS